MVAFTVWLFAVCALGTRSKPRTARNVQTLYRQERRDSLRLFMTLEVLARSCRRLRMVQFWVRSAVKC